MPKSEVKSGSSVEALKAGVEQLSLPQNVFIPKISGARFDPDAWYDQSSVAESLGWSPRSLERWRSTGSGPPYSKVAGRVLYLGADINAWLEEARHPRFKDRRKRLAKDK